MPTHRQHPAHPIHASVGPPSSPDHRYLACIEPTGRCGGNGTLRFELRLPSTADAMPPKRRRRRLARTLDIDPGAINVFVAASPPIVADPWVYVLICLLLFFDPPSWSSLLT
jgi:hypothetical protein